MASPSPLGARTAALLEVLASAVVFADPGDDSSIARLRSVLQQLQPLLDDSVAAAARIELDRGLALLHGEAPAGRLDDALACASAALELLHRPPEAPAPPAAATPATSTAASSLIQRDPDTIMLFTDFLAECTDLLAAGDNLLLKTEREGAGTEEVNGLFRVFHTIKGIAGFLEIRHITELGHTTEAMLDRCRGAGALPLVGARLDLVFDATGMLRRMLDEVRTAIEQQVVCTTAEDVASLLARIGAATGGEDAAPQASQDRPDAARATARVAPAPLPPPAAAAANAFPPPSVRPLSQLPSPPRPPAPAAAAPGSAEASRGDDVQLRQTIKVDLDRVDSLVEMIGELVVVEAQVVGSPEIGGLGSERVRNCLAQLAKVTRDLQDVGMRMRMVPVAGAFQKMDRMVRDLARKAGKQVRVTLSGEATEMDRTIVEQMADPLLHMVRNAVDHGLERAEERTARGKPAEGQMRLSAYYEGGTSVVEVADDGRGLDRDAILRHAIERGLLGQGSQLSDEETFNLIFAPGLSTARQVTEVSGRGVGMDVVKRSIEALHGRILIRSAVGQGTTFKIILPLTLAIIDGMLVSCGRERYILPTLSIVESIRPEHSMLVTFAGATEMINLRGQILPLIRLARLFELPSAESDPTQGLVVVVEGLGSKVGLLVDDVVSQQQVVIKTLGGGLGEVRFVSGAAILADGRVGLILNVEDLACCGQTRALRPRAEGRTPSLRLAPARAEEVYP